MFLATGCCHFFQSTSPYNGVRKYQFPFHLYQKLSLTGAKAHDEQLADHDRFATASLSSLDRFVDGIFLSGPTTESERR